MKRKFFQRLLSMTLASAMVVLTGAGTLPADTVKAADTTETEDTDLGYEPRLTPHMGWAPWNEFEIHTTGDIFIQQMDLMKEYGLIDVGYTYFTTEETWQYGRDENGVLQYNETKFPHGMAYYAEYAHSLGMKAGIYSDIGEDTCVSGRAGSPGNGQGFGYYPYENDDQYMGNCIGVGLYGHEEQDLRMLLMPEGWNYDFIKVDWCGGRNLNWDKLTKGADQYNEAGKIIEKLRKEKGEDILYNVCCWEFPGAKVVNGDSDSWRTGGDLWASWSSVLNAIDNTKAVKDGKPVYEYSAPGKANDLDMLQVGRGLTYEEDKSHFSMWCMAASPLTIGMDLAKITPETLAIFKNTEMIAVDQDPACIGGHVTKTIPSSVFNDGDGQPVEIWRKDLGKKDSQTRAIALFNRANRERTITVNWEELGFNGDVVVRDLWQHKYIDVEADHTVTLPAHGTIVYKVEGQENASGIVTETSSIYGSATDLLDNEVNLEAEGKLDYIQFGGANGDVAAKKAGADLLQKYTTGEGAAVKSADSIITYKTENAAEKKGAAQSALNSRFTMTLPAAEKMTKANFYLGVKDALVSARVTIGTAVFEESITGIGAGSNKVFNVYYKSDDPIEVSFTLEGTQGEDPLMRLDAVTLSESTGPIVLNPAVTQSDASVIINVRTIQQDNDTEAKKVEAILYDESGNIKSSKTADIAAGTDVTTRIELESFRNFVGMLEINVLDDYGNVIGKSFTYQMPMANMEDSGLIGHYTARKMVKEQNAVLVDVRSKEEFAESGVKGTLNIPLADLALKGESILSSYGIEKNRNIIVYCASGRRSQQARQILQYMGYANTYDLKTYENWLYGANVNFTNYQEIILNNAPIYLTLEGSQYEDIELRYSIGKDSTVEDSKEYTGPITLNQSDRIKAYVIFEGDVVYESYDDYLVFVDELPDLAALNELDGVFCSDIDFIVEESHESYTPDRSKVTPTEEGIKRDKNSKGQDMYIKGHKFEKGIAAHAPSYVTYNIPEGMNRFVAVAGVDDTAGDRSNTYTVLFSIFIDGKLTGQIIRMTTGRFYTFDIEIPKGAKKLQLVAKKGNSSLHSGENMFTEWGYARFMYDPDYEGNNPTGANVALNKPVIATKNQSSNYSAEKAVDGKTDVTRWSASSGSGKLPQAIQIDLEAIYQLDTISTYWFGAEREYTYNLYLTDEPVIEGNAIKADAVPIVAQLKGDGYETANAKIAEDDILRSNYNFLGRARGRYLTISVTKATDEYGDDIDLASLWEIEAYGTKVDDIFELDELQLVAPKPTTTTLTSAVAEAEKVDLSNYTAESVAAFQAALKKAQEALNNPNAQQSEIDAALKALSAAKAALAASLKTGDTFSVSDIEYQITKADAANGTVTVSKIPAKNSTVTIPAAIKDKNGVSYNVTAIANNASAKNSKVKTLVIGENVTNIGAKSFYNCKNLKKITFKGKNLPKIGKNAFKGIKKNCKVFVNKKMSKKNFDKLKKQLQKMAGKKISVKQKKV